MCSRWQYVAVHSFFRFDEAAENNVYTVIIYGDHMSQLLRLYIGIRWSLLQNATET